MGDPSPQRSETQRRVEVGGNGIMVEIDVAAERSYGETRPLMTDSSD
jgi:hypothetical protein